MTLDTPTIAPTPTGSPTDFPTHAPIYERCESLNIPLQVVFIKDITCGLSESECSAQMNFASNLLQKTKGDGSDEHKYTPKVGWIECCASPLIVFNLSDTSINDQKYEATISKQQLINNLYDPIRKRECSAGESTTKSWCIHSALKMFGNDLFNPNIVKKIVFMTDCGTSNINELGDGDVCENEGILNAFAIDFFELRIGSHATNDLDCLNSNLLLEFQRNDGEITDNGFKTPESISKCLTLQEKICETPTFSPTIKPESDTPTKYPTASPSDSPTRDPTPYPTDSPTRNPTPIPTGIMLH